jgi:choline dehydrogenase-like flavoprotein
MIHKLETPQRTHTRVGRLRRGGHWIFAADYGYSAARDGQTFRPKSRDELAAGREVTTDMTIVVIGSGPAAAAATCALCDAGVSVTVLDAGDRIEPGRMELFDALAQSEPDEWQRELADRARSAFPADIGHVPLKPAYGSLFPYALEDSDLTLASDGADMVSSLAYGGLSNAWGASILPYRQSDIADWPIGVDALEPHYEAVQRFVPVAAERDELIETLPLYTDSPVALRRGEQAAKLLAHLRRHTEGLQAAGFAFGASRLAVAAAEEDPRHCRYSGMCLYGCPYGSIYNAAHTFDMLRRSGRVDYRGRIYVDRLTEVNGVVEIFFHERGHAAATGVLRASRVFVACGALSSTRLVLASRAHPRPAGPMHDSQYFVIPMLTPRAAPVSTATQGNTLAQVFVELSGSHVSRHSIHLQMYCYNDIMLSALARRLRMRADRFERASRSVVGRLVVIQGFLHSSDSPGLAISWDAGRLRVVGEDVTAATIRVRSLVRRLAAYGRLLGMMPLPGLLHLGRPGKSNHVGGTLPMRREPGELETDVLGRIPAWERVHIVDASIFPSVPATTVTLSVMANAHRIATNALKIEAERTGL